MKIAVPKESHRSETRVAATPETVKKMIDHGLYVQVERGAGLAASHSDQAFENAGAVLTSSYAQTVQDADVVLKVRAPIKEDDLDEITSLKPQTILIGLLSPYTSRYSLQTYAQAGITAVSMDMMPRITRAQSMDVLSSQANLAGYRSVIESAHIFDRAFPMMMTAAGTIAPARVLILGAGVAGLQAVATARRLGAIVSVFDVRAAAKEQVESLGGKFISVEQTATISGDNGQGYAREMDADYQARQAAKIAETLKTQDIVITTAQIPGKPAPKLIIQDMIEAMKPGSVVIDLAVESGGNCALSQDQTLVVHNDIKIMGFSNIVTRIARDASALYARNIFSFLTLLLPKGTTQAHLNFEDPIIKGVTLTHQLQIVHDMFQSKESN